MTARPNPDIRDDVLICRWCRGVDGTVVLDLGDQPPADHFPAVNDPGPDARYPLRMWLCSGCGLAQLAEDPTTPEEPRGAEPDALVAQARDAVARVLAAGLVPDGGTAREFGSPHGGSWLDLLEAAGLREAVDAPADLVIDCFGLMHSEDQRAALAERVAATARGGVLLLQFHTLAAIVADGGWNALRHGHFAYYSTPVLVSMLRELGFDTTHGFLFDLYGGTVLLAARRPDEPGPRDPAAVDALIARETALGVVEARTVGGLEAQASRSADGLRALLESSRASARTVIGYAAASRAVPLLNRADIGPELLPAVADGATGKHGLRIPGAGIPIVAPEEVAARRPDEVVLFVTDMLTEMRRRMPEVEAGGGTWVVVDPTVKRVPPVGAPSPLQR